MSREGREGSEGKTLNQHLPILTEEATGKIILDAAFKVHTVLGPGLLESIYEAALAIELSKQGLVVERQKPISVKYDGHLLDVDPQVAQSEARGVEGSEVRRAHDQVGPLVLGMAVQPPAEGLRLAVASKWSCFEISGECVSSAAAIPVQRPEENARNPV